jgi:hypothetical protein
VYIWYIFPVLVYCAKKYLATLLEGKKNKMGGRRLFCVSYITFVEAKKNWRLYKNPFIPLTAFVSNLFLIL